MYDAGCQGRMVERVNEVYVAVFPIPINGDHKAEVILAGYQRDPNMPNQSLVRATVETHRQAVPDLVELCDEIVDQQEEVESYRLLKFDKDGIHILNPDDYRTFEQQFVNVEWGWC